MPGSLFLPAQPFVWLGAFARRARGRLAGKGRTGFEVDGLTASLTTASYPGLNAGACAPHGLPRSFAAPERVNESRERTFSFAGKQMAQSDRLSRR